jgi:hypothetical protein
VKRIEVDFNTLTSEPVGLVKLYQVGMPGGDELLPLQEGERVLLWEPGLEVEATVVFDVAARYWMAKPDKATWRDMPLSPELEAELEQR